MEYRMNEIYFLTRPVDYFTPTSDDTLTKQNFVSRDKVTQEAFKTIPVK